MSDLPLELIDYILTFADAPSLYELAHVSHALSYLSQKHIYHHHIQHASLRLWMHQPGTMMHRPIGFDLKKAATPTKLTDTLHTTVEFTYTGDPIPFDATKSMSVDGCTIIFGHHHYHPGLNQPASKKHYGLTYDDAPIVINNIGRTWTMEKHDQWSMHGQVDQDGRYLPLGLSCNVSLFNPDLLDSLLQQQTDRLKDRVQLKKQEQAMHGKSMATKPTSLFGGMTSSKGSCTPKSIDLLSPSSDTPTKHLQTSPLTSISS